MAHAPNTMKRIYPAMSHPTADPAVTAVAARFAGMEPPAPTRARILEIGCASGHHLLPLAMRWPQARLTGIDHCTDAILMASGLAAESKLTDRVEFHACALEDFAACDAEYDYIIAHGFYSWVPDPVKQRLLEFCARHLSANGLAVISFNLAAGWHMRLDVVRKVRAIQQADGGIDEMAALAVMKEATQDAETLAIIDDMLAKGPEILPFDDFAPVNDPCSLEDFLSAAGAAGLRWLGESRVSDNRPPGWTSADEAEAATMRGSLSPAAFHQWLDQRAGRTFRSALLCRGDAPLTGRLQVEEVFQFALRPASPGPPDAPDGARAIHQALMAHWPSAVPAQILLESLPDVNPQEIARAVCEALIHGWLWARNEPLAVSQMPPARPALDPLRLACARRRLPLVDAWHRPCTFPALQIPLLELCDGSRTLDELRDCARSLVPGLDFDRWLAHLHERGFFLDLSAR